MKGKGKMKFTKTNAKTLNEFINKTKVRGVVKTGEWLGKKKQYRSDCQGVIMKLGKESLKPGYSGSNWIDENVSQYQIQKAKEYFAKNTKAYYCFVINMKKLEEVIETLDESFLDDELYKEIINFYAKNHTVKHDRKSWIDDYYGNR